jgi:glutamate racemase
MATIGVFDSGVGGESVVNAIQKALPSHEVIYTDDKKNVPYGEKSTDELYALSLPILNMLSIKCDVIVIACNTLTTNIIERLRTSLSVPLIGMEPMVKPAAEKTKRGVIAVCATPATLQSARYKWLKDTYASNVKVLEPDCTEWARMIESEQVDHEKIQKQISAVCEKGADVIVLGCTHYHWIEEEIQGIASKYGAVVLQPEQPVIEQLTKVLEQQT